MPDQTLLTEIPETVLGGFQAVLYDAPYGEAVATIRFPKANRFWPAEPEEPYSVTEIVTAMVDTERALNSLTPCGAGWILVGLDVTELADFHRHPEVVPQDAPVLAAYGRATAT